MAQVGYVVGRSADERRPPSLWSAWMGLCLALTCVSAFLVSMVLPYYVNGLQGSSQKELWAHDMTELWPYGTMFDRPIALAGLFAITMGPFLAAATLWWSGRVLWVHRGRLSSRVRTVVVATMLVSAAMMSWLPTSLAGQLISWFLD